jgi:signal transduction histidine kinase
MLKHQLEPGIRRGLRILLAHKISLLCGTAVLLVIAVTLWSPWLQMTALNRQAMLLQAKRVAGAAYQSVDLRRPDWSAAQSELERRWPGFVRELELPSAPPMFIPADSAVLPPQGFRREAIERLSANPEQRYYWRLQDEERVFRFAMAVRGADTDAHPSALRGIIDVRLLMPKASGVWNSVVTVLAGASGAVLAILVFYMVIQRLVLSPVNTLRSAAERVSEGHTEARSLITTGDEFQDLSETFNDMLAHLNAAQEEQRKINRSLDVKLGELAEMNVGLYESNRLKNEFLANVTHELRTPLVSIIGFAELIRDAWDAPEPDRARLTRYSENILTSGRSLLEIINDLLDLAKIEAGKLQLHLSDFSIGELCRDLADFVRPLCDKRNQQLALEVADGLPRFHSDSGKIKQILYNLLSNAIKFTPTGGMISLYAEHAGNESVRLIVKDTGPGIAEEQRQTIFEKFRQLDASKTREHEGTGLGLAISRDLAQMLGGIIELDSNPGQGATFVVTLPATAQRDVQTPRISLT